MKHKPRGRPIPDGGTGRSSGHLAEDDRGNITWQWANDAALHADGEDGRFDRLAALADPELKLAEPGPPGRPVAEVTEPRTGYNPYNSGELRKRTWRKKRDMRRLSEWIALRKRLAARKAADDDQ